MLLYELTCENKECKVWLVRAKAESGPGIQQPTVFHCPACREEMKIQRVLDAASPEATQPMDRVSRPC
jgi:hypothetical protein